MVKCGHNDERVTHILDGVGRVFANHSGVLPIDDALAEAGVWNAYQGILDTCPVCLDQIHTGYARLVSLYV